MSNIPAVRTQHHDTNGVYAHLSPSVGSLPSDVHIFNFTIRGIAGGNVQYDAQSGVTSITYTSGAQSTSSDVAVADALIATLVGMEVL